MLGALVGAPEAHYMHRARDEWSGQWDSNPTLGVWKTLVLPLNTMVANWSGIPVTIRCLDVGNVPYYHCTNAAVLVYRRLDVLVGAAPNPPDDRICCGGCGGRWYGSNYLLRDLGAQPY